MKLLNVIPIKRKQQTYFGKRKICFYNFCYQEGIYKKDRVSKENNNIKRKEKNHGQ